MWPSKYGTNFCGDLLYLALVHPPACVSDEDICYRNNVIYLLSQNDNKSFDNAFLHLWLCILIWRINCKCDDICLLEIRYFQRHDYELNLEKDVSNFIGVNFHIGEHLLREVGSEQRERQEKSEGNVGLSELHLTNYCPGFSRVGLSKLHLTNYCPGFSRVGLSELHLTN